MNSKNVSARSGKKKVWCIKDGKSELRYYKIDYVRYKILHKH